MGCIIHKSMAPIPNNSDKNGATTEDHTHPSAAVVMVSLPAQGHLNQLLHLTRLIAAHNIPVHFAGTATHNRQAKTRLHGWDPSATANIHFHDFPTPPFDNPLPDPNAAVKFPTQIIPSLRSSAELRQPVNDLVNELSPTVKRIVVIYDSFMAHVVQDCHSNIPNAEFYCFQIISAFSMYSFYCEVTGKPAPPSEAEIIRQVPSLDGCFPPEFSDFWKLKQEAEKINSGDIYNTSRVIDGLYLDLMAKEKFTGTDRNWAIGPFNPVSNISDQKNRSIISDEEKHCLEWLDKQNPNSVVFVSFGTTSSLTEEQITEIALGLEKSGHSFIWVLRDADKGDIFQGEIRRAPLPENYEENVRGRGLVLREWAPQLAILGHPSTGGFVTHCGWNSCIESISMGVPVAVWPMHSDQPRNAVLMTKVLKIGLELKDWSRRDEVVTADEVEEVVRRLMGSDEGDEIRRRATELGDSVRKSLARGGISSNELDSFIAHITR